MYDRLFVGHGVDWGGAPRRDLKAMSEFAAELKLDQQRFDSCLADPTVEAAILQERDAAVRAGINSTPNFIINGQVLRGALPIGTFQRAIAQATP